MLLLLLVPVGFYVFYTILIAIYYLYWDSLAHIPGRKTWIVFPISKQIASLRGTLDSDTRQMHLDHGPIIRLGPRELSFITGQAWTDIYGFGHPQLPKTRRSPPNEVHSIISADDTNHARFRKAMSHAFSEKALRDQEILMKKYIDLLIEKLGDIAVSGLKTDMVKWYNHTTFDLIGDLAFGQSFGCLVNSQTHFWVENVLRFVRTGALLRIGYDYPNLMRIIQLFMSSKSSEIRKSQFEWTRETVLNRINNEDLQGRKDFMGSMLRYKGHELELSEAELISNSNILVLAGSETTATLLCGVTYYLSKNSGILKRATDEVRTQFEHQEEITFNAATAKLPYMLACLNEALRRYPPFPGTMTRKTLAGDPTTISGIHVPANTMVGVHHSAMYWSPTNFHDPLGFHPERWLPEALQPSSPFYNDDRDVLQPFHVGPRNCIGKNLAYNEMRLILARILWNFDLELCVESENWDDQKTYILWTEKPDLNVLLTKRKGDS